MLNKEFNVILNEDEEILSHSFEIEKERIIKDLKEKHIQHRKFMREQEERKLLDEETQKKLLAEQEKLQALKSESTSNAYVDRRFRAMSAKAIAQNERMKNLLNKVDTYMKRIEKIDEIQTLKIQAEKEFIQEEKKKKVDSKELGNIVGRLTKLSKQGLVERENNIKKMKEREKSKNKIMKNAKTLGKGLLSNLLPSIIRPATAGVTTTVVATKNKMNNLFNLEEDLVGTNAMPDNESFNHSINQSENNTGSEKILQKNLQSRTYKSTKSNLNIINDRQEAEIELRKILKNGATAESLMKFKNKYKWFDISPYLHKVQMEMVKKRTKNKNIINEYNRSKIIAEKMTKFANFSKNENFPENENEEISENNKSQNNDISLSHSISFPSACLYNNSSLIQSKLLACKDDAEVFNLVNEKDEFNRKGIIYLILHGNYPMIKLCLMSGLILSDTRDKFNRNFLHYIALSKSTKLIEVFCKCFSYEYKEDYEGMMKYMGKIYLKENVDEQLELTEEEKSEMLSYIENSFENFKNEENLNYENQPQQDEEYKLTVMSSKQSNNDHLKFTNSMTVTNHINFYYQELKRNKLSLQALINQYDCDNRSALHLACKYNNIEVIKTLLFHNANVELKDKMNNRPIDYCSHDNESIIQYIMSHSKNIKSKLKLEQSSFMGKILGVTVTTGNKNINNLNENNAQLNESMLDVSNLKFIPDNKLNSFTNGIENNSYLILSIIEDKFDTFVYLLSRGVSISFVNSNGWNALHFIINLKRYKYLYYIFNLDKEEKNNSTNKISEIYEKLKSTEYSSSDLFDSSGNLTIIGQAFLSLDIMTNNQLNILYMSIDSKLENCYLFKILVNLLIKREMLLKSGIVLKDKSSHAQNSQISLSSIEIILNRKYDKSLSTLLLKIVLKKNFDLLLYFLKNLYEEYASYMNLNSFPTSDLSFDENNLINIYETDKTRQNVLHVIVKNKLDEKFLKFFIKLDADKNLLKSMKDSNEKTPQDYDTSKQYAHANGFIHIWEATRLNDHILLEKILQGNFYSVNEQTDLYGNTPLHIAAISGAEKTALCLVINSCDINIKNKKSLTPLDCALNNKNLPKNFIKKFRAIINKEITDYQGLESYGKISANNTIMNNSNLSFMNISTINNNSAMGRKVLSIINKIKAEVSKRKLDFKKIFETIDENKNGKLEGHEFESLFTVIDIEGVSRDDVLLLMSFLDRNKNGIIEYEEFMKILE
jgi:ankyrin repeat protein